MPNFDLGIKSKGGLYPEGDKRKSDRAPHFNGFINLTRDQAKHIAAHFKQDGTLDGVTVRLAAWKNQGDQGVQLSLQAETFPPDDIAPVGDEPPPRHVKMAETKAPPQDSLDNFDDFEDDIPF